MGVTPVDLYRSGNAAGPRMDRIRPTDIQIIQKNAVDWVDPATGGISTFDQQIWAARTWWMIPKGTAFSDLLVVRNDHGSHWLWEPAQAMELAEYRKLLADLNAEFCRV